MGDCALGAAIIAKGRLGLVALRRADGPLAPPPRRWPVAGFLAASSKPQPINYRGDDGKTVF